MLVVLPDVTEQNGPVITDHFKVIFDSQKWPVIDQRDLCLTFEESLCFVQTSLSLVLDIFNYIDNCLSDI